jgi:hypothetical protein
MQHSLCPASCLPASLPHHPAGSTVHVLSARGAHHERLRQRSGLRQDAAAGPPSGSAADGRSLLDRLASSRRALCCGLHLGWLPCVAPKTSVGWGGGLSRSMQIAWAGPSPRSTMRPAGVRRSLMPCPGRSRWTSWLARAAIAQRLLNRPIPRLCAADPNYHCRGLIGLTCGLSSTQFYWNHPPARAGGSSVVSP